MRDYQVRWPMGASGDGLKRPATSARYRRGIIAEKRMSRYNMTKWATLAGAALLAIGFAQVAHAQGAGGGGGGNGSNNANPLTSSTPAPGAPAMSTPGTTASPQSTNTAPTTPQGNTMTMPTSGGPAANPNTSSTGTNAGGGGGNASSPSK